MYRTHSPALVVMEQFRTGGTDGDGLMVRISVVGNIRFVFLLPAFVVREFSVLYFDSAYVLFWSFLKGNLNCCFGSVYL